MRSTTWELPVSVSVPCLAAIRAREEKKEERTIRSRSAIEPCGIHGKKCGKIIRSSARR